MDKRKADTDNDTRCDDKRQKCLPQALVVAYAVSTAEDKTAVVFAADCFNDRVKCDPHGNVEEIIKQCKNSFRWEERKNDSDKEEWERLSPKAVAYLRAFITEHEKDLISEKEIEAVVSPFDDSALLRPGHHLCIVWDTECEKEPDEWEGWKLNDEGFTVPKEGTMMERAMDELMRTWEKRSAVSAIVADKFIRAAQKDVCELVRDEELFRHGIDAQKKQLLACVELNVEVVDKKQWSDFAGKFADAIQSVLAERTGTLSYFDRWVRAKEINIKKKAGKKSLYHVFYDASQSAGKYTGIEVRYKSGGLIGTTTGKAARPTASTMGIIEVEQEDGTKIWLRGFGLISSTQHIVCDEDTEQVGLPGSCDVWMPIMMRMRMENSVFCTVCRSVITGMMMITNKNKIQCENCAAKDDAAYDEEGALIEDGCWMDVSVYLDSKK